MMLTCFVVRDAGTGEFSYSYPRQAMDMPAYCVVDGEFAKFMVRGRLRRVNEME